ncbi:MAG: hypothetical protein JO041_07830 [Acidobacteria bacterium]|nr:hypothetical protein [Acidobacteriota bacterium]
MERLATLDCNGSRRGDDPATPGTAANGFKGLAAPKPVVYNITISQKKVC